MDSQSSGTGQAQRHAQMRAAVEKGEGSRTRPQGGLWLVFETASLAFLRLSTWQDFLTTLVRVWIPIQRLPSPGCTWRRRKRPVELQKPGIWWDRH